MAKAKPAAKKAAVKKAAVKKKAAAPKVPFYAHILSKQDAGNLKATSNENDSLQTEKYPNDDADVIYKAEAGNVYSLQGKVTGRKKDQVVITLKYPSDSDEAVTLKYPSDGDEDIITIKEIDKADLRTTRYPSDDYAVALNTLQAYKSPKGAPKLKPTRPMNDVVYTMKYPSDNDEDIVTMKYPSDKDEIATK
jgi:hypothetical protein